MSCSSKALSTVPVTILGWLLLLDDFQELTKALVSASWLTAHQMSQESNHIPILQTLKDTQLVSDS